MKTVLHVGCGPQHILGSHGFDADKWREVRLDVNPAAQPDIIGSMTDMAAVASGSMDAVYSAHNIEHLYPHEVPLALREFRRVLKPDGFALIICPDIQAVAELVAQGKLLDPAYQSPAGPIAPLDMMFGHRPSLAAGDLFMAHHTAFTLSSLIQACIDAGFGKATGERSALFGLSVLATVKA